MCYSKIVKPNITLRKLKEKTKKEKCGQNIGVSKNLIFSSSSISLGSKGNETSPKYSVQRFHNFFTYFLILARFACVEIFILYLYHCLKINESFE